MKSFIGCLLFAGLCGIMFSLSHAQLNQNTQKPNPEIETLKNRISELESKLQTVENVEKMELAAKLADAQAKLRNAEFGKFERELRDANNEWLRTWSLWFASIIGFLVLIVGGAFWFWLRSRADELIVNSVEKSLNGFEAAVVQVDILKNELKEAAGQVNILQDQIKILEKEHAASMLRNFMPYRPEDYPEQIKVLPEQALLDVFSDETCHLELRGKAAKVLTYKESPRLVSPALKFLNSVIDSDFDWEKNFQTQYYIGDLASFIGYISTPEAYEGLKNSLSVC